MKKLLLFLIILAVFDAQAQFNNSPQHLSYMNILSINTDSIYDGHNYEYYADIYKKATSLHRAGIGLTSAGAGLLIVGGILIINSEDVDANDRRAGDVLSISGLISLNAGIPLWIAGGSMKVNNRETMEIIQEIELSFRTTNYGIGLVLNF